MHLLMAVGPDEELSVCIPCPEASGCRIREQKAGSNEVVFEHCPPRSRLLQAEFLTHDGEALVEENT